MLQKGIYKVLTLILEVIAFYDLWINMLSLATHEVSMTYTSLTIQGFLRGAWGSDFKM